MLWPWLPEAEAPETALWTSPSAASAILPP